MDKVMNRIIAAISIIACLPVWVQADTFDNQLHLLVSEWDVITFELPEAKQEERYEQLLKKLNQLIDKYPDRAEPLVWKGITLSTYAGAKGGLSALSIIKQSRESLLAAEKLGPNVEEGSIYTTLGSLYYMAPGWPISFGNDDQAEVYLRKALTIAPDGIDTNFFYGDYLIEQGRYKEALPVLRHALEAAPRNGRKLADDGRKVEILKRIAAAEKKLL